MSRYDEDLMDEPEVVEESSEKDDYVYDEITGGKGKKPALAMLNKKIVGKFEMDELMCDWE